MELMAAVGVKDLNDSLSMADAVWTPDEMRRAREQPAVVHFMSRVKPWIATHSQRDRTRWSRALDTTPRAGWRPQPS